MQYRSDRYGNKISALGYGCMRFTQSGGKVDVAKAEKEIMEAYRGGVNYFDTAYIYPGSEAALGEILARNGIRQQVNIATKLPHYLIKKPESMEAYFSEELRRTENRHHGFRTERQGKEDSFVKREEVFWQLWPTANGMQWADCRVSCVQ